MRPTRRRMKPEIRAIVEWAEYHGWHCRDRKDGNGHWVLEHPEFGNTRLPDTPSDRRGLANAKAEIRRRSGLASDSGPAGKYRHEPRRRDQFSMDDVVRERRLRAAYAEAAAQARRRLTEDLELARAELNRIDPRREPVRAREQAAVIVALLDKLRDSP